MASPARVAAYTVLRAVNDRRRDLPAAIASARRHLPDERDRALAAEIATGTLRWLAQLDYVIETFAKRPASRLDPEILDILRLTAYQLLHLDRIPASAAVDEAVELCRRSGKRSATGFVNAVLRAISRSRNRLPLPRRPTYEEFKDGPPADAGTIRDDRLNVRRHDGSALDYLSVTLSHPRWLAARWMARFGFEAAERWARFNNVAAPLTIRANALRLSRAELADRLAGQGVETEPATFAPDGLIVTKGNPLQTALAEEGSFFVQDEASQLVGFFANALPGERVFDACASPGGKTLQMAATMHERGMIVAGDFRPSRVNLLRKTIASAGARSVRVVQTDLRRPLPFGEAFDCVLVDAPCSGLGTIRRDPEIRWRRTEADLAAYAASQRIMIDEAASVVRTGGRLVYSTCSSEPEENDEVIAAFLTRRDDFVLDDPRLHGDVPAGLAAVLDSHGCLRTLPHIHGLECFFAATLRRLHRQRTAA